MLFSITVLKLDQELSPFLRKQLITSIPKAKQFHISNLPSYQIDKTQLLKSLQPGLLHDTHLVSLLQSSLDPVSC